MKKFASFLLLFILLLTSIACGTSGTLTGVSPTPVETDACCLQEPTYQEEQPPLTPEAFINEPGISIQTGWYPYVNANVVRDLVVYQDVVYAATLGGVVTWWLDDGFSMKYTPLNGMGHVSAYSIAYCEIPEPRILVGTLSGISIYDPATGLWEQRALTPADSRVDVSKIERLYCDQTNNRLMIGYTGLGVLDLSAGSFQRFTRDQGLLWDSISDITVQGKDIWVAHGYKGIAQISNGKVTTYTTANGLPDESAYSLAFDRDGTLWVGASGGLMSFKNNKWTSFGVDGPAGLGNVNEIEIATDGAIWVTTLPLGTGKLCQFDPKSAACVVDFREVDGQGIHALALTENGSPVYGTNQGVYFFVNNMALPFKTEDQLASNYVDSFGLAPDGALWVGTDAGLHVLDSIQPEIEWTTFQPKTTPGLGGAWISAIAFGTNDTAWVSVINGSASRYQYGEWTSFDNIYSFNSVTVDQQGRAWFGDDGKGIIVMDQDMQVMKLTTAEGLPGDNVQALITDEFGRVWIGTDQGLAKYENETLEVVFSKDDTRIPNKYIRALALDPYGALLIGTFTGVARYDGTQVEILADFLKDGFSEARLTTLAVSSFGRVWVGTDKGLLYQNDRGGWSMLTTQDGLLTNYISALQVDPYDALWVGGGGSNFDGGGMLKIVP